MKISVFGAGGFIGRNLVMSLLQKGHQVTGFDRQFHFALPGANLVRGQFENRDEALAGIGDSELLYFLISNSSPISSMSHPERELEAMLLPTVRVFQSAVDAGVRRIGFASSGGSIYGMATSTVTEMSLPQPVSPHAIVKSAIENYLRYFQFKHGIGYDIFRISNAYGPGQVYQPGGVGVIAHWMDLIAEGRPIEIWGTGELTKDYIFIDDICELMSISADRKDPTGDIFNVSSGRNHSLNEIVDILKMVVDCNFEVRYVDAKKGDVNTVEVANEKILRHLPNHQFLSLAEGVRRMWEARNL